MAPQQPPNNGRESLQFSLGGKSIGIQAASLTTILLLILISVGGYLLWISTDHRIEAILTGQERLLSSNNANRESVLTALNQMQAFVTTEVTASQQRIMIREQWHQDHLKDLLEVIRRWFVTHEWNQHQDAESRLPIEITPDIFDKPPTKSKQ